MVEIENPYPLPYEERHFPWEARSEESVWPDDARIACAFYIATEEWQWDENEPGPPMRNRRDEHGLSLSTRTGVKYGYDVGLRRLNEVLSDRDVNVTFYTSGNAVEQHPDIMKEMHDSGHEIAAHMYSEGKGVLNFEKDGLREDVLETRDLITELTGEEPVGWLGPGAVATVDTIEVLAEEDFLYNGDLQDDELPYFIDINGNTILQVTYRMIGNINDYHTTFNNRGGYRRSPSEMVDYLTDTFDYYYKEASERPLLLNYGMHPYVSGRPDGAQVLGEFIDHIQNYEDVWFAPFKEVAEYWQDEYGDGYV
jgi:peptidoglycan/xylan/chitin deacetylase (PgdA/CDA1 family)